MTKQRAAAKLLDWESVWRW